MGDRDRRDQDRRRITGRWRLAPLFALCRPALVAAGIGLVLSLAGAATVARWEDGLNRIEFESAAETEAMVIQNGMNEYISRLVALRTLFESINEHITRSEFESFSARLFESHPGILRIGWLPRVSRKERAEYEAAAVTDGVSGYRIKSLQGESFATAPQSDEYFPVFYSTQPKTSPVYGMDYATVPERRAVLERARDHDLVSAIRARLYEPRPGGRLSDILVALPVYAKGTTRETVGPASQSGRLCHRRVRPAAADAGHSCDDRRKPRDQHERLSALPRGKSRASSRSCRIIRPLPPRRNRCATSGSACTGRAISGSEIPIGRCARCRRPAVRWK
jgi:CHASE domain